MASPLTKKYGPLPMWGWMAVAVGASLLYIHQKNKGGTGTQIPPNQAIDPATGVPYALEGSSVGLQVPAGVATNGTSPIITASQEIQDVTGLATALQGFIPSAPAQGQSTAYDTFSGELTDFASSVAAIAGLQKALTPARVTIKPRTKPRGKTKPKGKTKPGSKSRPATGPHGTPAKPGTRIKSQPTKPKSKSKVKVKGR